MRWRRHMAAPLALLLASCAAPSTLAFKSTPLPMSAVVKQVPARIAEGQGLLAMGNVGLAIEAFRKAHRDDPRSASALAGLAACYDQMGRFELSGRYYEQALANAPADRAILAALARSLERQGRLSEAQAVRQEAALSQRIATPTPSPIVGQADPGAAAIAPGASITVALPAVDDRRDNAAVISRETTKASAKPAPERLVDSSPRLERLSLGEVALVTTSPSHWRSQPVRRTATSTTVRFVALEPRRSGSSIRLLNAARYQGLAAHTRLRLAGKGWQHVSIGDANRVRQKSLVLYSPSTAQAAHRLAAQFGFRIAKEARPGPLTVLLGRDAIARRRPTA